jgi:predicted ATPase
VNEAFIRSARLAPAAEGEERVGYPWELGVAKALGADLALDPKVTFLIGENGSGKSTLIEALAVAAGLNPEGGSDQIRFSTRASESPLAQRITLVRGVRRPKMAFFLRAESVFNLATQIEALPGNLDDNLRPYGGTSLHEQSHGESFLAVLLNRFGDGGLYFLDEPEAALSTQNQLTLLARMLDLARAGCQFVVATHSPILLAYPGALILRCHEHGVEPVAYDDAEPVRLTRAFLGDPGTFLNALTR